MNLLVVKTIRGVSDQGTLMATLFMSKEFELAEMPRVGDRLRLDELGCDIIIGPLTWNERGDGGPILDLGVMDLGEDHYDNFVDMLRDTKWDVSTGYRGRKDRTLAVFMERYKEDIFGDAYFQSNIEGE